MTTVGYGDKAPKSAMARIFSVVWILFGLIAMAIFMANVTTALTALSLQLEPTSLRGVQVGVIGNGTEYQHALKEDAHPKSNECIVTDGQVLKKPSSNIKQKIYGIFNISLTMTSASLDHLGVLPLHIKEVLALQLKMYMVNYRNFEHQTSSKSFNLFDCSSPFVKYLMYISLGLLVLMLLIGLAWDILLRKKGKGKQNTVIVAVDDSGAMTTKEDSIRADLETTRVLLRQALEQFDQLESKVSKLKLI
ncbi:unnamed protein product [Pocillopora meandrina]|uniref:Potassium channel domain-containing protein n=1 Tax=Pocillopora meandrina TaxID=46732 RepID=A0AAU9WN40_9CNID|nr:unnamed protein product [Pocillopora meandrina]